MQKPLPPPSFAAPSTGRLKRLGVRGAATVALIGDALRITGAEGGVLVLPPVRVRRLRAGWQEVKYGIHHETRLWLVGEAKPLVLHLYGHDAAGYVPVIRGFAAAIAEAGGLARLETGTTPASALYMPIAFGLLALAAIGVAIFALENEPWWGRLIVPAIPIPLFILGIVIARRSWPKPAADLAAFNRAVTR